VKFLKGLDHFKFAKGAQAITLHDALTMSSGLEISKEKVDDYQGNPQKYYGIAQVQAYFEDTAPIVASAKTFRYQSFNPIIIMNVLSAVVPGSVENFAKNELFHKMNIANYDWRTREVGILTAESGSSVTSRNMIKIGTLIMNNGRWGNEQLIPKAYIEKMTEKHTPALTEEQVFSSGDKVLTNAYGYFWWQTDVNVGEKVYSSHSAQGAGGVTILVIDELDVVVVVTGHAMQSYIQLITEKVLPTFI
jgi:CubicO group peptidase (beta-lactamase class C family)